MAAAVDPSPDIARRSGRFYLPELDALRFFAFLAVFCCHVARASGPFGPNPCPRWLEIASDLGSFGVDLFFVLSAYLITELLLRERERFGRVDRLSFYIRRALRIWPLYFAFVAIAFTALRMPWIFWPFFVAFVGNFAIYLDPAVSLSVFPLWSVSIEEQFYLVWAMLAGRLSRSAIASTAIVIWLLSVAIRTHMALGSARHDRDLLCFFTPAHLDPIACGILIAAHKPRAGNRRSLLIAGIILLLIAATFKLHTKFPSVAAVSTGYVIIALGCGAIMLATIGYSGRFMTHPWTIYLGRISYGLYVIHCSMLLLCAHILPLAAGIIGWTLYVGSTFVLTVALASISYRWIESPFLRLKSRFQHVPSGQ